MWTGHSEFGWSQLHLMAAGQHRLHMICQARPGKMKMWDFVCTLLRISSWWQQNSKPSTGLLKAWGLLFDCSGRTAPSSTPCCWSWNIQDGVFTHMPSVLTRIVGKTGGLATMAQLRSLCLGPCSHCWLGFLALLYVVLGLFSFYMVLPHRVLLWLRLLIAWKMDSKRKKVKAACSSGLRSLLHSMGWS